MGKNVVKIEGREERWMGEDEKIEEGEGEDIIDINMGWNEKKVKGGY